MVEVLMGKRLPVDKVDGASEEEMEEMSSQHGKNTTRNRRK